MAKFKCKICGYIYDEEKEGVKFADLPDDYKCPMCGAPKNLFEKLEEELTNSDKQENIDSLNHLTNSDIKKLVTTIRKQAETGISEISSMSTLKPVINFDEILLLGVQLAKFPLLEEESVNLKTVIGKKSLKPLKIDLPVFVSHMSFGALSKEAKTALAIGSAQAKTAIGSGEGGILPEEKNNAYRYIFEYVPNKYSVTDEALKQADAIEIKIGQAAKPGMGGHLPKEKVTKEIALIRSKEENQDILSPSRFKEINSKQDLAELVASLKKRSLGRPVGLKLAAGHIEQDLEIALFADVDFITIDGRKGASGASPTYLKDNTSVPTIYALYRARKYLDEHQAQVDLIITGGLYKASDFAKAIAMGADAVAIATAAMIALGCDQYRICHTGMCPKGIATQDENLRKRLDVAKSSKAVANYFNVVKKELITFAKITGKDDIHKLNAADLITTSDEIAKYTNIKHA